MSVVVAWRLSVVFSKIKEVQGVIVIQKPVRRHWIGLSVGMLAANAVAAERDRRGELEHTRDSLALVKARVARKQAVLVDVRGDIEWQAGHIQGAVYLPWRDPQDRLNEVELRAKLPVGTIVYTYCAVGYRALRAGSIIARFGYDVRPLKPGYEELVRAGFPNEVKP